jgi:hypothetical protein
MVVEVFVLVGSFLLLFLFFAAAAAIVAAVLVAVLVRVEALPYLSQQEPF